MDRPTAWREMQRLAALPDPGPLDRFLARWRHLFGPKGKPPKCGARRKRDGEACQARAVPGKRRCKFHGGLSTGPKTAEGRARIAEAQRKRWAARISSPASQTTP